jgi:hypothetical protein
MNGVMMMRRINGAMRLMITPSLLSLRKTLLISRRTECLLLMRKAIPSIMN